ncbi:MAG: hypothetical protein ACLSS9_15395 [Acutalibacteraceae bacterium]
MAQKSSFFNAQLQSGAYDRTYLAEDFAAYFASFVGNGVFPSCGWLQVTAGSGMQVSLGSGKAWMNGYYYINTSACLFTLDTADGVLNRIDSIVIRWDKTARSITAAVKKGAYAVTPSAPAVTRTEDVYELQVAEITVSAGITSLTQANITDTRQNAALCGIVAGVVDQIDATGLFAQYDSTFQAFMASIEGTLSDDVAGNLLLLINQHKADRSVHITTLTHVKSGVNHALTGLKGAAGILSCQFKATAGYNAALDTLTVDGVSYTIKLSSGEKAEDNLFVSGAVVPCIVDTAGKTVNFKAAGGGLKFNPAALQVTPIGYFNLAWNGYGALIRKHENKMFCFYSNQYYYWNPINYVDGFPEKQTNSTTHDILAVNIQNDVFFTSLSKVLTSYTISGNQISTKSTSFYRIEPYNAIEYGTGFIGFWYDSTKATCIGAYIDRSLNSQWEKDVVSASGDSTKAPHVIGDNDSSIYLTVQDASNNLWLYTIQKSTGTITGRKQFAVNPASVSYGGITGDGSVAFGSDASPPNIEFYNSNLQKVATVSKTGGTSYAFPYKDKFLIFHQYSSSFEIAIYNTNGTKYTELRNSKELFLNQGNSNVYPKIDNQKNIYIANNSNYLFAITDAYLTDFKGILK